MNYKDEITPYRMKINTLNEEILYKIKERIQVAIEIGKIKNKYNKPIVDKIREKKILQEVKTIALKNNLDPEGAVRVFKEIIQLCVESEERI